MTTDPYRYFRIEAQELLEGLSHGVLAIEAGARDPAVIAQLLRHAHTLKGAARIVRQLHIAELSHRIEEILVPSRDAAQPVVAEQIVELLTLIDQMGVELQKLEAAPAPAPEAPATRDKGGEEVFQTVRIEIQEMDAVMRAVTETGVQLSTLKRDVARLQQIVGLSSSLASRLSADNASDGKSRTTLQRLATDLRTELERVTLTLGAGIERVDQELADVREGTDRLRLVPAESLFQAFVRAARDAALSLGKQVQVQTAGGALRLDAQVLGPLRDALLHLARNAIAHGIESSNDRTAAGKPAAGTVRLEVERNRDQVVFTCHDDGKGIDVQAVRRGLITRGLVNAADAAAMPDQVVIDRLVSAGITTAVSVTQLSGRGVGLDVVRETAQRLQGHVEILSTPGQGTHVALHVPISLAAQRVLVVELGTSVVAIPLDAVRKVLRLTEGNISHSPQGASTVHGDKVIPFLPLAGVLHQRGTFQRRSAWPAVVVGVGERAVALGVDRLRGTFDVIVRPLPLAIGADAVVAGAFFDPEGNPQLVLDAAALLTAPDRQQEDASESEPQTNLPILVIDDSLTTRMLEQSILESAGYEVDLAVSAEQGLEKAHQRSYGIFIVDVEMPGMDGFEFVARTRSDPHLGCVPAILVTSRASNDDFRRGQQAGASAYIVKGEFDQNLLLDRIRRLMNEAHTTL